MKDIKENIIRLFYIILTVISIYSIMSIDISSGQVDDYAKKPHKWGTFPVIYIEPFDANDKTKSVQFKGAVKDALERWVDNSAVVWILDKEDNDNKANVVVKWIDDSVIPARISGDTDSVGYASVTFNNNGIVTGPNTVYIVKKNPDNSEIKWDVARDIALHEFGHIFGLGHSEVENDVMNKTIVIERNGIYESNRAISTRDKTMLNDVFKGFVTDFSTGIDNNKLTVNYKLDSVLGDLKNVKIRLEYTIDGNGPYSIVRNREKDKSYTQILSELKKDTPFSTSYTTDKDIKDVKQVELGIYILDATIPKKDNAKFMGYEYPNYYGPDHDTTGKYYDKTIDLEPDKCYYCHTIEITECLENTPPGHNIRTSASPNIEMTYETVITCGTTSSDRVSDFEINNYKVYAIYDISTTSLYSGNIEIDMSYSNFLIDDEDIRLLHYEEYWKDITTSVDSSSRIITGNVNSLSLFALVGKQKTIKGGIDLSTIIMIAIVLITISIIGIRKINKK